MMATPGRCSGRFLLHFNIVIPPLIDHIKSVFANLTRLAVEEVVDAILRASHNSNSPYHNKKRWK